jgi:hypothetical protein
MATALLLDDDTLLAARKGSYSVSGTVLSGGSPVARYVLCFSGDGVSLLGTTFSAADGTYSFTGLAYNQPVLVVVPGVGTENPRVHKVTPG